MSDELNGPRAGFVAAQVPLSVTLLAACSAERPPTTPSPEVLIGHRTCQDGRDGRAGPETGAAVLGVALEGKGHAPGTLPLASEVGVISTRTDASLFWKLPMSVNSADLVGIAIAPPHYLAYVRPAVWTTSSGGVQVDPWIARELNIAACEDGTGQWYLGRLLIAPGAPCVTLRITWGEGERARSEEVRPAAAPGGC